jgi:hypothetical protein
MPIKKKDAEVTPHTSKDIASDAIVNKARKLAEGWSSRLQGYLALAMGAFFSLDYFELYNHALEFVRLALAAWGTFKSELIATAIDWFEKLSDKRSTLKRVSLMQNTTMYLLRTFIFVGLSLTVEAHVISGYKITIKGLGTNILLGDYHKRYQDDQEQFDLLVNYLRSRTPGSTAFNIEILPPDLTDIHAIFQPSAPQRFPETKILTKLRILMAGLKESDLSKKVLFTSSDPRSSRVWLIFTKGNEHVGLKRLVIEALQRTKEDPNLNSIASFEKDFDSMLTYFHPNYSMQLKKA